MNKGLTRRRAIQLMGGATGLSFLSQQASPFFNGKTILKRPIPSSGEMLPVVGVGTWIQFDVSRSDYKPLLEVLNRMNEKGGKVIDSSPMYGNSETVIGDLTTSLNKSDEYFYATKVWVNGKKEGISQMESSMKKMRRKSPRHGKRPNTGTGKRKPAVLTWPSQRVHVELESLVKTATQWVNLMLQGASEASCSLR